MSKTKMFIKSSGEWRGDAFLYKFACREVLANTTRILSNEGDNITVTDGYMLDFLLKVFSGDLDKVIQVDGARSVMNPHAAHRLHYDQIGFEWQGYIYHYGEHCVCPKCANMKLIYSWIEEFYDERPAIGKISTLVGPKIDESYTIETEPITIDTGNNRYLFRHYSNGDTDISESSGEGYSYIFDSMSRFLMIMFGDFREIAEFLDRRVNIGGNHTKLNTTKVFDGIKYYFDSECRCRHCATYQLINTYLEGLFDH
jgi:hypothetical protein